MGWNDDDKASQRLYDLGRLVSDWLWETDAEGRFTFLSDRLMQLVEIHPTEMIGKKFDDLGTFPLNESKGTLAKDFLKRPFRDLPFQIKSTKTSHFNLSGVPFFSDETGAYLGARGTASDITARKAAEQAVKDKEELVEVLFQMTVQANQSVDIAEALQTCMKIVCEYLGWSVGHVLVVSPMGREHGLISTSIWHVEKGSDFSDFIKLTETKIYNEETLPGAALKNCTPVYLIDITKGRDKPRVEAALNVGIKSTCSMPILVGNDVAAVIEFFSKSPIAIDRSFGSLLEHMGTLLGRIIERKSAEDSLKNSEKRIRAVMNNVVDAIITIDDRGTIRSVNPAAENMFGYRMDEMVGRNVNILMPEPHYSLHDDYIKNYLKTGNSAILGKTRELEACRKGGAIFPIDLSTSELTLGDERLFVGIIRDITERKRIDSLKKEFISTVSHELRTPLTSIMGALGLVAGGTVPGVPDKAREMIEIAYSNSHRLVQLINDILDMEKIETGRMIFDHRLVDLPKMIEQTVRDNQAYAEKCGVRFAFACMVDNMVVEGDEGRLRQVMENLLSNAAKFSPEGEEVLITLDRIDAGARISVIDKGVGIPEEFHNRIYEKFTQSDGTDSRKIGGTGLGLSIVKAIVEHHNGEISFETEVGKGTTFYVVFPEKIMADVDHAAGDGKYSGSTKNLDIPRVLVCEDDRELALLFAGILQESGVKVDIAVSAEEAKEHLARTPYSLLMLDLVLPGQDGISLIRELRENPETKSMPIVVASARAKEGQLAIGSEALDVIDWMEKPIDEKRLLDGMMRVLNAVGVLAEGRKRPRILHVEDDPDVVKIISQLVEGVADLTPASSIREARLLLQQVDYDLVILDLGLPDGKGESLLPLLGREDHLPVPVIVFSASEIDQKEAQAVTKALVKSKTSHAELLRTICRAINAKCQPARTNAPSAMGENDVAT